MRLRPAPVSRRQVCGWSCCAEVPISMATLYVDLGRSVTVVGSTPNIHSSANITGDGPWSLGDFSWYRLSSGVSGNNHDSCLTFSDGLASVVWWILVGEGSTGVASLISFSDLPGHSGDIDSSDYNSVGYS